MEKLCEFWYNEWKLEEEEEKNTDIFSSEWLYFWIFEEKKDKKFYKSNQKFLQFSSVEEGKKSDK